jgi:hypothetical protein
VAACGFHAALGFGRVVMLVEVHKRHIRAFFGKEQRHSAPDAAVTAGNQGNLALQLSATPVRVVLGSGPWCHGRLNPWLPVLMLRRL